MASKFVRVPFRHHIRHLKQYTYNEYTNTRRYSLNLCSKSNSLNTKQPTVPLYWQHHPTTNVAIRYLSSQKEATLARDYININEDSKYIDPKETNSMQDKNEDGDNNKSVIPSNDFFDRALSRFPGGEGMGDNRCFSYAYGSGVFQQVGHNPPKGNMTDFILAVNDPLEWHRENIEKNPSDYAGLMRVLGANFVTEMQTRWGARLYFNTLVPFEDGKIKYGVISRADLIADLLDWDSLYSAGRLQKPVRILEKPTKQGDPDLHLALRMNLASAVHTALLLLPDRFSEEKLYCTIAGLSYAGDFRMAVGGEDKNKVKNIVQPSIPQFRTLYSKQLVKMSKFINFSPGLSEIEQDVSPAGRHHHLSMLPKNLQGWLVSVWNEDGRYRDVEDVLRAAAYERESGDILNTCLKKVAWDLSITQAIKGIFTAGISKSFTYGFAKLKKGLKSSALFKNKMS